jgi:hypothetical protein
MWIAATNVAGLEEGRASLVCLIHCLVWDLLLMTKELSEERVAPPEEEMTEPILARQDEYQ